jgi:hypothetical protein
MATATDVFPGDINIARCIHGDSLTRILADSAQVGSPQHGSGGIQLYDERVVASDRLAEAGARGTLSPAELRLEHAGRGGEGGRVSDTVR